MKIAIISDIHASFPALRPVREDELWAIGDLVAKDIERLVAPPTETGSAGS